ncbi:MAG: NnrU family protein [Polyangiales bacterium]
MASRLARVFLVVASLASVAHADIPPIPTAPMRPSGDPPAEAVALLERHGCTGCHSVDGRAGIGPTFQGTVERLRYTTLDDPELRSYLVRSLREPSAELASAPHGAPYDDVMPAFTRLSDDEVDALVDAVIAIPPRGMEPPPEGRVGFPLFAAMLAFVLLHFVLSSRAIRAALVSRLGEGAFQGLYSVLVGLPFAAAMFLWEDTRYVPFWTPPRWASHLSLTVMPFALFFLVAGFSTKSPTTAGMTKLATDPPRGVITITRHPALIGFTLWGAVHLVANGAMRDVFFFAPMVVLSVGGIAHIEARRRRANPEAWAAFAAQTSIVPFVAILRGRTKLDGRGLALRLVITLVLYAALLLVLHRWAFGVPALPPEWNLGF